MGTPNADPKKVSIWERIPSALKAVAGLIAAIAGLITVLNAVGLFNPTPAPTAEPGSPTAQAILGEAVVTPTATPTATQSPPTWTPSPSPTSTPTATPTLLAFDRFDDGCIDTLRWHPVPPVEGNPPDEVDETNCWTLSNIHRIAETAAELKFRASGQSSDGIVRIKKPCTFTDLEVIVSRFALSPLSEDRNASGYVGMVVDSPDEDFQTAQVGVWLGGRQTTSVPSPSFFTFANRAIEGLPDLPTQQLFRALPRGEGLDRIALGFHLVEGLAYGSVNGELFKLSGVEMPSPYSFRIVFGTTSGSVLDSAIEEVRVGWDPERRGSPDCPLS